ncbi:MAG: hypothetical protein OQK79_05935, partial [Rhodanobacter sp.]|nr:hypothetical protein [Rhodanobacter sp.]
MAGHHAPNVSGNPAIAAGRRVVDRCPRGGQFASAIGSGLTGFALGVWVYTQTHQVTDFALICLATVAPALLLAPIAGALVDR